MVDFAVSAQLAAALLFAAADSGVLPRREVVAGSMAAVGLRAADSTAVAGFAVAAHPTEGAAGSCYSILLSHLNGWQPMLPAVFFFFWA
jgi:hypothetical protein